MWGNGDSFIVFLSTLSLRRATYNAFKAFPAFGYFYPRSPCGERLSLALYSPLPANFYPRSPCGERRCQSCNNHANNGISIHALLAESDSFCAKLSKICGYFYPRSPCGERPPKVGAMRAVSIISIHALLAESDWCSGSPQCHECYFYPRSPCGERRIHPGHS